MFRDGQSDRFGGLSSAVFHCLVSTRHAGHARSSLPGRNLRSGFREATKLLSSDEPPFPYTLLPLTIPEVRHLLASLLWPLPRNPTLLLSWSWWRRSHQSRASYFHTKRRCTAG